MGKTRYNRYPGRVHVNATRKEFDPYKNDRQVEAWKDDSRFILFGGAIGGGKSFWLCADALKYMLLYPDNRGVIVRATRKLILDTVVPTLDRIINPRIIKSYNRSRLIYTFRNKSELHLRGSNMAQDPEFEDFKSTEWGWFGMEEASQMPKNLYTVLRTRLRWKRHEHPEWARVGRLTTNPENCWLYSHFIKKSGKNEKYIQSKTSDNYSEDDEYYQDLIDAFDGDQDLIDRYMRGIWTTKEHMNQLIGNAIINKCYDPLYTGDRLGIGVDPARFGQDEAVIQVIRNSNALPPVIFDKCDEHEIAEKVAELMNEHDVPETQVAVDGVGVGGGVVTILKHTFKKNVIEINGGNTPIDTENLKMLKPYNFRAQLFLQLKEDMKDNRLGGIINDGLREEFSSIRFMIAGEKKIKIMKKEDIKKFFGRSPGRVEALSYANWAADARVLKKTGVRRIA